MTLAFLAAVSWRPERGRVPAFPWLAVAAFYALIAKKKFLPNVVSRFCTQELKIRPMRDFARSLGWDYWTNVVGLRADERHRVASLKEGALRERWDVETPLATAGVAKADVSAFWSTRNWALNLPSVRDQTPLGNCDLCFLKGAATLVGIMRMFPDLAPWWVAKETEIGGQWSKRFSYAAMAATAKQPDLLASLSKSNDRIGDCYCTGDS